MPFLLLILTLCGCLDKMVGKTLGKALNGLPQSSSNPCCCAMKKIKDSKRFLVGWGGDKNYPTFFIAHSELPETLGDPVPTAPVDLASRMIKMVKRIEKRRKRK